MMIFNFHSEVDSERKKHIKCFLSKIISNELGCVGSFEIKEKSKISGSYEVSVLINGYKFAFWQKVIFIRNDEVLTNINSSDLDIFNLMSTKKIETFKYDIDSSVGEQTSKNYFLLDNEIIPVFIVVSEFNDQYNTRIIHGVNMEVIHEYSGARGAIPSLSHIAHHNTGLQNVNFDRYYNVQDNPDEVLIGSGIDELGSEQVLYLSYYGKTSKYETSFDNNGEKILTGFGRRIGSQLSIIMKQAGKDADKLHPNFRNFSSSLVVDDSSTVSAHNYAHQFYKYLDDTYQHKSLDGNGGIIVSFPHAYADIGQSGANASYSIPTSDTEGFIKYGEGYIHTINGVDVEIALPPLRCYDVAVHELTHGITYYMFDGNIEYIGEPGGVNEFLSDTMAFLCTENWEFGEYNIGNYWASIGKNVPAWRSYSDPKSVYNVFLSDHSDYPVKYSERYKGEEDYGGVHINITIPGKATWLMTLGGEHNGVTITAPVGYQKMRQILFHSYKYLTSQSNYHDIRFAFIQSATDLYPDDSRITGTISAAFDSVELFERSPVIG